MITWGVISFVLLVVGVLGAILSDRYGTDEEGFVCWKLAYTFVISVIVGCIGFGSTLTWLVTWWVNNG